LDIAALFSYLIHAGFWAFNKPVGSNRAKADKNISVILFIAILFGKISI